MAGSFNTITLIGYLGRDPEVRKTGAGHPVASFTVASDDRRKDEDQRTTTWFRLSCFDRLAEIAEQYLRKGSYVYVQGSLSQEQFTDRDGQQRTSLEIRVRDLQMLDRKGEQDISVNGNSPKAGRSAPATDDQVPF